MRLSETEQMHNLVDEDGKPTRAGVRRFEENWRLIERDTISAALQRLKPQLDATKAMFIAGDREGLLAELAKTAPVRYQQNDLSLADAQLRNDIAKLALCCLQARLDSQGLIYPLGFRYQSHLGQSSGDVERAHMADLSGAGTPEQQATARELYKARNPEDAAVLARQEAALLQVRAALGLAVQQ